jgi:hypothetical protein
VPPDAALHLQGHEHAFFRQIGDGMIRLSRLQPGIGAQIASGRYAHGTPAERVHHLGRWQIGKRVKEMPDFYTSSAIRKKSGYFFPRPPSHTEGQLSNAGSAVAEFRRDTRRALRLSAYIATSTN